MKKVLQNVVVFIIALILIGCKHESQATQTSPLDALVGSTENNSLSQGKSNADAVNAMKTVMDEDARLSRMMSNSFSVLDLNTDAGLDQMATVIRGYVAEARQYNMAICPKEFIDAFQRNIAANESMADVVSEHPHITGTLEQAIVYDTSKYQEGSDAWRQRLDAQNRIVQKTWNDVEAILSNYIMGKHSIVTLDSQKKMDLPAITNLGSSCADGFFHDTASFINNSGQDLTGVLVAIKLTGEDGVVHRVYGEYYWPVWRSGESKEVGIAGGQSVIHVKSAILTGDCDQGIIGYGPVHR